jgi:hypothetical protein
MNRKSLFNVIYEAVMNDYTGSDEIVSVYIKYVGDEVYEAELLVNTGEIVVLGYYWIANNGVVLSRSKL